MTLEEYTYPHLREVLNEYGKRLSEAMRENLKENGTNASNGLYDSIRFSVDTPVAGEFEVNIHLNDYWKWVEYGTSPHWAPIKPLREWVRVKPGLPKVPGFEYAVQRKIARVGTLPQPFVVPASDDVFTEFETRIYLAVVEDIRDLTDMWLEEIKNIKT